MNLRISMTLMLFLGLAGTVVDAAIRTSRIRAYDTHSDSLDYVFTAVLRSGEDGPVLSFNDRNDRTSFVRIGEKLGPYTVKSFEPLVERVYKSSVNKTTEKQSGFVVLEDARGKTYGAKMGERLSLSGLRTSLVLLDTGDRGSGRASQEIKLGGVDMMIRRVSQDAVTLSVGIYEWEVPQLSDDERQEVSVLLKQQKEAREQRRQLAMQRRKEAEEARAQAKLLPAAPALAAPVEPPRQTVAARSQPQWYFGTEYRYPTAYDVIPPSFDPYGRMVFPGFVVPRAFETRNVGMGMSVQAYPMIFGGNGAGFSSVSRTGGMTITVDANLGGGMGGRVRF